MKSLFKLAIVVLAIIGGAYVYKSYNEGKTADEVTNELNLNKAVNSGKNIANGIYDVIKKEVSSYTSEDLEKLKEERKKFKKGSEEYEILTEKINEAKEYLKNHEN